MAKSGRPTSQELGDPGHAARVDAVAALVRYFGDLGTALAQLAHQPPGVVRVAMRSWRPLARITVLPVRSTSGGSAKGTMAANSTAPARTSGWRSSSAEAMFAPLEKPTAYHE